ncbi:hypothetical protein DSO57_1020077 [Entomophthora muscae]|uniref:Uncharacterized protein n=1 Tax=Entomophthora muscae TaxID=34485 RepID=A0ACC2SGS4_9FUNG|nr:hypothetical protein DSO57_1020077 [Entomophthora muscae]
MIEPTLDEHQLTIQQICARYDTDVEETEPVKSLGLNQEQIARIRSEFGENIMRPPKQTHPFFKFMKCLLSVFNILLLFAGALTLTLYSTNPQINYSDMYLGICLFVVVMMNSSIEFIQQQRSASLLDSFMKMVPQLCNAVRMGSVIQVPASELVVGDVVFIRMGDKVPADMRLFHTTLLKVDNSSLTGETDPQERLPTNEHSNPLEATNIAFSGTLVVAGEGYGVVIRTGDQTVLGQIANMTSDEGKFKSPLSQEIHQFVGMIAGLAMVTTTVFLVVGLLRHTDLHVLLNFAIGTFVAFIPEGLPITVTMLLFVAASRMAGQQVLVKDLQGLETLGAITLLATDKTGTLTCNEMAVANVWTSMTLHGPFEKEKIHAIMGVLRIAILNSQVKYDRIDIPFEKRRLIGDATELGLARFGHRHHPEFASLDTTLPRVFGIPFNSDSKVAVTIHQDGKDLLLFVKGAPERVLIKCDQILIDGHPTPLLTHHVDAFHETYKTMASQGHRIIAFAQMKLDSNQFPIGHDFEMAQKSQLQEWCLLAWHLWKTLPSMGFAKPLESAAWLEYRS